MVLKSAREEDRIVAGLCDEEGNPYAVVEFVGEYEE